MSDLNRVTLSGRLVADPELKYLPSGTAVTNLRLASNRSFTSNGERRDEALFVDVEVYGKPGEALAQHKAKGDFLLVDGRLRQHTWEREGQRHSRLAIVADQVSFGPNTKGAGGAPRPRARTRTTCRSDAAGARGPDRAAARGRDPGRRFIPAAGSPSSPPTESPSHRAASCQAMSRRAAAASRRTRCHACLPPAAAGATGASP